ncbi:MAG: alanine--tRNA ligase, partial [Actinobacteria bacterium]|nr:alanine--tRNA ligase [Actinomycetota bacterium]
KADLSLRIVADHSRAITFMIADGILPSNEGRGYVLRRLLRRAVRHGHVIGIEGAFLDHYVEAIVAEMGSVYPELVENKALIERVVLSEEERFGQTLRQGQAYLDEVLETLTPGEILSGNAAFTLHDTYGFPIELTREISTEQGHDVDLEAFDVEMNAQRERARAALKDEAWSTYGGIFSDLLNLCGPTRFVGYAEDTQVTHVQALVKAGQSVEHAGAGDEIDVILDETPFYGEKGGQAGDKGTISDDKGLLVRIQDTQIPENGLYVHKGIVEKGSIEVGATVEATIDVLRRERIRRNHTATHILHWALRVVLGDHVKQAGSFVGPDRLRFDFTHFEAVSDEQLVEVERLANEKIMENNEVRAYETSLTTARETGVTALFGEKYGEFVRVLECGAFSKELCGGTHVGKTSEIGFLKVINESSVGSNMRRIEAVTSFDALSYVNSLLDELQQTANELHVSVKDVFKRTASNLRRMKELEDAVDRAKKAAAEGDVSSLLENHFDVGYPLVITRVKEAESQDLRALWDIVSVRLPKPGAMVIASQTDTGSPLLLAAGSKEAVALGFDAGNVIKRSEE